MKFAGEMIRKGYGKYSNWRNYANSRKQAREFRKLVVRKNGGSHVTSAMVKSMKQEMKQRFGDAGHWPWIALYTELREEYIPGWVPDDFYSLEMLPFLNPADLTRVSTLKSFDHRIFKKSAIKPIAMKINGLFFGPSFTTLTENEFFELLRQYDDEVVIKQDKSASGKGIVFKCSANVEAGDFIKGTSYIIQPLARQHPGLARIYSKSVNTVRISTYLSNSGEVTVKHSLLRVGSGGRRIVNAGLEDLDLYLTDNGTANSNAINGIGLDAGNSHPDSGYLYREIKVPSMDKAIRLCKNAHLKFPYLRFIGWDLYIDPDGTPHLFEWNTVKPSLWVHEAKKGPLWSKGEIDEVLSENKK